MIPTAEASIAPREYVIITACIITSPSAAQTTIGHQRHTPRLGVIEKQ